MSAMSAMGAMNDMSSPQGEGEGQIRNPKSEIRRPKELDSGAWGGFDWDLEDNFGSFVWRAREKALTV